MEEPLAGAGCLGLVVAVALFVYPYLALGRIWLYSKQQVELLEEIRDLQVRIVNTSDQSGSQR